MSGNIRIVILIRPEDSFCIYIHMVINQIQIQHISLDYNTFNSFIIINRNFN